MNQYLVQYALSNDPDATATSGFASSSNMNNLEITIPAPGISQAQAIVEAIFGGPQRVWVKSVMPVYG
jgi:hypothetical protein